MSVARRLHEAISVLPQEHGGSTANSWKRLPAAAGGSYPHLTVAPPAGGSYPHLTVTTPGRRQLPSPDGRPPAGALRSQSMLVLDTHEHWQLIEQPDHAELAGMLAESFGAGPFSAAPAALLSAAHRHDDGWAIWDRHPLAGEQGEPVGFLQAPVEPLLRSYEACADAVAYEDPHAGLLVSMHVSGLRRGRYGRAPDSASRMTPPVPPQEDPRITRFVEREHERQAALLAGVSLSDTERWHQYAQLQLFDVLSLQLCLTDLQRSGEPRELDAAPTTAGAAETVLTLTPLGEGRVTLQPWPFRDDPPLHVSVRRRLLPRGRFAGTGQLREAFAAAEPDRLRIELVKTG